MAGDSAPLFQTVLRELCRTSTKKVKLSQNAKFLLAQRYLRLDDSGQVIEAPEDMFRRVATGLAAVEAPAVARQWARAFFEIMARLEFHPGSRTLANVGSQQPQLANCFVFPLEDSRESIFRTFSESSIVKSLGGGCGFNYSNIRPRGDSVRGAHGVAVGPVALLAMFDQATRLFRQRGRYESGNMAILNVDHPDIFEFIDAKRLDGSLSLTNMSLGTTDRFMTAVKEDAPWTLVNPRTGYATRTTAAREILHAASDAACRTGDPGLVFLDRLNQDNPLLEQCGAISATNTCGEIGLYPYEACNLGYINLPAMLKPGGSRLTGIFDWNRLRLAVSVGVRMIDNAITLSWSPFEHISRVVASNRRIGIGVTGWADCLARAKIPYDSPEALELAEQLSSRTYAAAFEASVALGSERKPFPNVRLSHWRDCMQQPRNVALLALPPSGNNAIIFNSSFSIEPFFGLTYTQRVLGDDLIEQVNGQLLNELSAREVPTEGVLDAIRRNGGSIQGLINIPDDLRAVFKTAHDIAPEWHVRMQAAFQGHVDNAVTKTVNLPRSASADDVTKLFTLAWELRCKGITIYRDTSRVNQAMEFYAAPEMNREEMAPCAICAS